MSEKINLMPWYKDRDFPEIKTSNAEILAVVTDEKSLTKLIEIHNSVLNELGKAILKISLLEQDLESEKRSHRITLDSGNEYIYELKKHIEELQKDKIDRSCLRCGNCGNIGMFHNGFAMADELTKLKKSREGLRQACEFYASSDQWNCTKEQLTTYNTIDKDDLGVGDFQFACDVDDDRVGGKKAREALKADDELMK